MIKKVKVTDLVCIDKITNSTEKEPNTSRRNKKIVKLNFKKHKQTKKRKKKKKKCVYLEKTKTKSGKTLCTNWWRLWSTGARIERLDTYWWPLHPGGSEWRPWMCTNRQRTKHLVIRNIRVSVIFTPMYHVINSSIDGMQNDLNLTPTH